MTEDANGSIRQGIALDLFDGPAGGVWVSKQDIGEGRGGCRRREAGIG